MTTQHQRDIQKHDRKVSDDYWLMIPKDQRVKVALETLAMGDPLSDPNPDDDDDE